MGLDPDPFDDIFVDNATKNNTRAGGKFQPKAKCGPLKKVSIVPSSPSLQTLETGDSAKNGSNVASQSEKLSETCDESCLESVYHREDVIRRENMDHSVDELSQSNVLITEWRSSSEKSVGEGADIFVGLKSRENFHHPSTTDTESPIPSETPAMWNAEERANSPQISLAQDPLIHGQPIVSINDGDCGVLDGRLEIEQMEPFTCLDSVDMPDLVRAGRRAGKFLPKPKIQIRKEIAKVSIATPNIEESICPMNDDSNPSGIEYTDKDSVSAFPPNEVLDLSSFCLDHSIPMDSLSQPSADDQPRGPIEASREHIDAEMHENIDSFRSTDLCPNQQTGRNLRPRRKHTDRYQLVDESGHEEIGEELSADFPGESVTDGANNEDFLVQGEFQLAKQRRNSKKTVDQKEKPVRNRKKAGEAPAKSTAKVPKKFSHSTRQKRRRVDKALLETPEDEIEFQKVPLRDLIILADYKEQMEKKEAATIAAHLNNQSLGTATECNKAALAPEQGEEDDDGRESCRIQENSININYQTFMNKTPRKRWSKQETQLFYEAVRQFGTNFSIIQNLFPGLTRRQIMLKFKNEERHHSQLLCEAITNRSNDHSHFKQVIQHLQQMAAEKKQSSHDDETIDLSDSEMAEQMPETNEETVKSDLQTEEGTFEDVEPAVSVQSPAKSYDSEGDEFDWSAYKSEL